MKALIFFLIVISFTSCSHNSTELKESKIESLATYEKDLLVVLNDLKKINWDEINPFTEKTDLDKMGLNGKIKSIREIPFSVLKKGEKFIKKDTIYSSQRNRQYFFNEDGNKVLGNIFMKSNKIFKTEYLYSINKKVEYRWREGKRSEFGVETYFDKDGNDLARVSYQKNGKRLGTQISKYHENGKLRIVSHYDYNGIKKGESEYSFDSKGNLLKYTSLGATGYTEIEDDSNGNKIEERRYRTVENIPEHLYYRYVYKYDKLNKLIEEIRYYYYPSGKIDACERYDGQQNILEYFRADSESDMPKGKTKIYSYLYDTKDNWIKSTVYDTYTHYESKKMSVPTKSELIPRYIYERKINYYD